MWNKRKNGFVYMDSLKVYPSEKEKNYVNNSYPEGGI